MSDQSFASRKFEVSVSGTHNITSVFTIVTYNVVLDGRLHNFLDGTATPSAYVKVIDPDEAQDNATFKIRAKRYKVRLGDNDQLIRTNKEVMEALGSEIVVEALKLAARVPPRYDIRFKRVLPYGAKLMGIINGKIVKDLSNPEVKPAVAMLVEYKTPHFMGWHPEGRTSSVGIAYDGDSYYEIVSKRKVVKFNFPTTGPVRAVEHKAKELLRKLGGELE